MTNLFDAMRDIPVYDGPDRCMHRGGQGSSLRTAYTSFDGVPTLWWVWCPVCDSRTEMCLTVGEAIARAEAGWWIGQTLPMKEVSE